MSKTLTAYLLHCQDEREEGEKNAVTEHMIKAVVKLPFLTWRHVQSGMVGCAKLFDLRLRSFSWSSFAHVLLSFWDFLKFIGAWKDLVENEVEEI